MAPKKQPKATPTSTPTAPAPAPKADAKKYADDDHSIDARMWRLEQDHIRMGSRPKT